MTTRPKLPDDESAFDRDTVDRMLSALGPDAVLVGGQALTFWMDRFGLAIARNTSVGVHARAFT